MPRLKLPLVDYRVLRHQVLNRDGWHCQLCGTSNNLHIHQLKSRSRLGDDALRNLITLCADCHETIHRRLRVLTIDHKKNAVANPLPNRNHILSSLPRHPHMLALET
jgi:predicted HNH restriction endonuclease